MTAATDPGLRVALLAAVAVGAGGWLVAAGLASRRGAAVRSRLVRPSARAVPAVPARVLGPRDPLGGDPLREPHHRRRGRGARPAAADPRPRPAPWSPVPALAVPAAVVPRRLRSRLEDLALPMRVEEAVGRWAFATGLAFLVATLTSGLAAAVVLVVLFVLMSAGVVVAARGRADRLVERSLPEVLDAVAAALRSGASLPGALDEARRAARGPVRDDLDHLAATYALGGSFSDVLEGWRARRPSGAVRATVAALAIAAAAGGGAARAVDGVAAGLRDRRAIGGELRALASQARASAVVIMAAPVAFVALTGTSDPEAWTFLTGTPIGLACCASGFLLDLAGGLWMVRIAGRPA